MRIVVAMSGGVDSSVAAALLAEQGHDVIGLSMQLYDQSEGQTSFGSCCSIDDLHDARRVAAAIHIPHYIVNFERQFDAQVISNFVREYAAGRTPLPCTHCNSDLKFAALADRARGFGADAVATGHYARQRQLPVADKPDSQEICFIPDHDYRSFVTRKVPEAARGGVFVDEHGDVLGTHEGIHRFTVGQRKGLGLGSPTGMPMYVLALRAADQQVIVGSKSAL